MNGVEKNFKLSQAMEEMLKVTNKNAVKDMKLAISLSITKNGQYTGVIVEPYLEKMYAYKEGCSDSTKQEWCNVIYETLCSVERREVKEVEDMLDCYEEAGVLIGRLKDESILDVARDFYAQEFNKSKRTFIEILVLVYSEYGLEFDDAIMNIEKKNKKGMSGAEVVMDDFMGRLENNEFKKDTESSSGEEFDPTDQIMVERIQNGYKKILDDIKKLNL